MWDKFKEFFTEAGTEGLKLPLAYDGAKPASARLFFSHMSFWLALVCIAANAAQSWTAIAFFSICTILYMFKEVDKFKFNATERSFELEDSEDSNGSQK